jgi:hypothetical protein
VLVSVLDVVADAVTFADSDLAPVSVLVLVSVLDVGGASALVA